MLFKQIKKFSKYFKLAFFLLAFFCVSNNVGIQKVSANDAVVKLNVPYHRQQYSLSCEVAALKMALNFAGVSVSENELISKLPFDPAPHRGNTWGDPDVGFVGKINGRMFSSGYGVYAAPIADLAKQYARGEVMENASAEMLVNNLDAGRPAVVWGYLGSGKVVNWKTPAGKQIYAVSQEHARVVYGYKKSDSGIEGFYVLDPITGDKFWPLGQFMKNWDRLNRMAVVVY